MRIVLVVFGWLAVGAGVIGCGGAPTQQDMMRMAIRRPSDESDGPKSPNTAAAAPQRQLAAAPAKSARPPLAAKHATTSGATKAAAAPAVRALQPTTSPGAAEQSRLEPASAPATPTRPLPQTVTEQRQWTIDNMSRIGKAIEDYCQTNGRFPSPAICAPDGRPLLSWRVQLLPQLGLTELYSKFDLAKPWDDPRNLPLLKEIPAVYQSAERLDERTNYLAPVGASTVSRDGRGLALRRVEDGTANTVVLLEVDDAAAVPWTSPADYVVDLNLPTRDLGQLRQDGFFVVFGGGVVRHVSSAVSGRQVRAIYSADGGEPVTFSQISSPALAQTSPVGTEPAVKTPPLGRLPDAPDASPPGSSLGARIGTRTANEEAQSRPGASSLASPQPVPTSDAQSRSLELFKEVYRDRHNRAKRPADKQALAREMLQQANQIDPASADHYVLLQVARRVAAEAGDSSAAEQAISEVERNYDVDTFRTRVELLESLASHASSAADSRYIVDKAKELMEKALADDDFATARQLHKLALDASQRDKNYPAVHELAKLKKDISASQDRFEQVKQSLEQLDNESLRDRARRVVGEYYCFHKGQWEKGLVMLAESSDAALAHLALTDLQEPATPERQAELADGWWKFADEVGKAQQRHVKLRAMHWYSKALPQLPSGLLKAKVEIRLKELPASGEVRSP